MPKPKRMVPQLRPAESGRRAETLAELEVATEEAGGSSPTNEKAGRSGRWTRQRDGQSMRTTTVHLPAELHAWAKVYCAKTEQTLGQLVAEHLHRLRGQFGD